MRAGCLLLLILSAITGAPQGEAPSEPQNIIAFLNQSIVWYQQQPELQKIATQPNEILLYGQNRQLADQALRLSFDFARMRAEMLPAAVTGFATSDQNTNPAQPPSRFQNLANAAAKADAAVKEQQKKVEDLKRQLATASKTKRLRLESVIADETSELELQQARADTLHNLLSFTSTAKTKGAKAGTLQEVVEQLARTVPGVELDAKSANAAAASSATVPLIAPAQPVKTDTSGLFGLTSSVLSLRHKVSTLDQGLELTDDLAGKSQNLRSPLVNDLQQLTHRGDILTAEPDSQDPKVLAQQRSDIEALTAQYKQLAATVLPLGKQALLLDLYRRNLAAWQASAQSEYKSAIKSLALRLAALVLILVLIFGISELWRRATFRYVHDKRRRFQFLLLRRIVVWSLTAIIIVLFFVTEISSLATFAGLLTAGLAVALQNVIVSIVGYFFLIGRYGVHLGDRVQVAGVTGNVVDIGLFRLHLMELAGSGPGSHPTGRIVVFPNSVVFQANSGLFKQAPGAKFVWHEIRVTLGPESDYQESERRMLEAVNSVFAEYKEKIAQQHHRMAQALAPVAISSPTPESRLDLTQNGLVISVRYPVDLDGAAEIDDRVTRAVLKATGREPKLRVVATAAPSAEDLESKAQAQEG